VKYFSHGIFGPPLLFAYREEWVIPAQESVTHSVIFMKDYYQQQHTGGIFIEAVEVENEGLAIEPIPRQGITTVLVICPGDDLFHGTLDPEEYVRAEDGGSREIAIQLQASQFKPRLVLVTEDEETGNWEQVKELVQEEGEGEETVFSCDLEEKEIKADQLYAVRLFCFENDTAPLQTIQLVFKGEDDDDSGPLPGFELVVALLVVVSLAGVRQYKRKP